MVAELQVVGNDASNKLCDCRSSGDVELVVVVLLEAQGQVLRGLRDEVKSLGMVACPLGGRSIVGDELVGGACGATCCGRGRGRQQE